MERELLFRQNKNPRRSALIMSYYVDECGNPLKEWYIKEREHECEYIFCPYCFRGQPKTDSDHCAICGKIFPKQVNASSSITDISVYRKADTLQTIVSTLGFNTNARSMVMYPVYEKMILSIQLKSGRSFAVTYRKYGSFPFRRLGDTCYDVSLCLDKSFLSRQKKAVEFLRQYLSDYYNSDFSDLSLKDICSRIRFHQYPKALEIYAPCRYSLSLEFFAEYRKLVKHLDKPNDQLMRYLCHRNGNVPKSIKRLFVSNYFLKFVYHFLITDMNFSNIDIIRRGLVTAPHELHIAELLFHGKTEEKREFAKEIVENLPDENDRLVFLIGLSGNIYEDRYGMKSNFDDIIRMLHILNDPGIYLAVVRDCRHFKTGVHNALIAYQRELRIKEAAQRKVMPFTYTESQIALQGNVDGYDFCLPETETALYDLGHNLHNCVWSYGDLVRSNISTIVAMYKGKKPLVCIELVEAKRRKARQALQACNRPMEPKLAAAFVKWANAHDILTDNCDGL